MNDLAELDIRTSAKVIAGVTTNRVKVQRPRRKRVKQPTVAKRRGRPPKFGPSPPPKQRAPRKAKPVRSSFGGDANVVQVCISISPAELAVFDAAAAALGITRSSFLRSAAHVLIATHAPLMSKPP